MFKEFGVTDLPDPSMDGKILYEYLGHLRAGNSIYKLACEACYETTASLMAKIGKEAYEDKLEQYRIESGLTNASTDTSDD